MIEWTVLAARRMAVVDEILVATDHEAIAEAVRAAGAEPVMTDPELPSGTDRVNAAIIGRPADIIINLQGDEPGMPAETVAAAHRALLADEGAAAATACVAIHARAEFENPNVVKAVRGANGRALYFSRSPIPSLARREAQDGVFGYKHLGLYIYRREALERFCQLPQSSLETMERLEQLRMLENGMPLVCVLSDEDSIGVDTAEDVSAAEKFLSSLIE